MANKITFKFDEKSEKWTDQQNDLIKIKPYYKSLLPKIEQNDKGNWRIKK